MSTKASTIQRAALAVAKAALTGSGQQSNGSQQSAPSPDRKAGLSTGKAILMGAGLMVAGQALVKARGQAALDAVRHGLAQKLEAGLHGSGDDSEDADFEDNGYEDDEYDDEPEAEADEDFEDEDFEDEPEAEEDEDFEDEEDEDFEDDGEVEQPPRRSRREKAGSGSRRK